IRARAGAKLGNSDDARQFASQAESLLASLEQKWGGDNYKSYVARPDVVDMRAQTHSASEKRGIPEHAAALLADEVQPRAGLLTDLVFSAFRVAVATRCNRSSSCAFDRSLL